MKFTTSLNDDWRQRSAVAFSTVPELRTVGASRRVSGDCLGVPGDYRYTKPFCYRPEGQPRQYGKTKYALHRPETAVESVELVFCNSRLPALVGLLP